MSLLASYFIHMRKNLVKGSGLHIDPELLVQLPPYGCFRMLSEIHLASGELPLAGSEPGVLMLPGNKYLAPTHNDGCRNKYRILLHATPGRGLYLSITL